MALQLSCGASDRPDQETLDIGPTDVAAVQQNVAKAELIFVGRVRYADREWWTPNLSIAPPRARFLYRVLDMLKGDHGMEGSVIEVFELLVLKHTYIEEDPRTGKFRPSIRVFAPHTEHIVFARRYPRDIGPHYLAGVPSASIWSNTLSNREIVKRLITEEREAPVPVPPK